MTLLEQIAEKIVAIRYEVLPNEAVEWAKAAILDTVGVTLAGASEDCARIVEKTLAVGASHGACLIFGSDRRTGPRARRIGSRPPGACTGRSRQDTRPDRDRG